jgi:ABC-2 type transport system permease protein
VSTLLVNEVLKLRTVRTWWLVLIATEVLVLLGVTGRVINAGQVNDPAIPSGAAAHVGLASLFLLVLGITAVAGEYRHKTIVETYLATPHRGRVIQAKLYVYTVVGLVFGIIASATAIGALALELAARGGSLDLSDGALWRTLVGAVVWQALFAAIGVGVGALVRNLAGAVAVALAWVAVVEGVLAELASGLSRWLPANLGTRLADMQDTSGGIPQWLAGVVLIGYTVVIAAAALATSVRRDVV